MQQARRTNPYPWTWEIPAAIIATVLLVMALSLHLGRAVANLFAGGGLVFTPRSALFSSLPGLVTGDAAAGLPAPVGAHASSPRLWFWMAATELAVVVVIALMVGVGLRQWGPGRIQGMASPQETDKLLGLSRLRRNAAMIRPDLYGKGRTS